jgi:hypothetical protein
MKDEKEPSVLGVFVGELLHCFFTGDTERSWRGSK